MSASRIASIPERSTPPPAGARRARRAAAGRSGRRYAALVAAIVVGALALRLIRLGEASVWVDEINVLSFVRSGRLLTDLRARGGPFEPPLHFGAVWLALKLPFDFETAARIPAAVFGALEVLMVALVARRLTRRRDVAVVAAAFLAVAPFAVRYSQEVRYYTAFSALHLLTWWLLLRLLDPHRRRDVVAYGAGVAALLLAHPFAPLVVVVQVAVLVVVRARRRASARRADGPHPTDHPAGTPPRDTAPAGRELLLAGGVAALLALPWFVWGLFRWIPDLEQGRSYALNSGERPNVALNPDLYRRVFEWVLGNSGRASLLVLLLAGLALVAPLLWSGRPRLVAVAVLVYVLGFLTALVPLAWTVRTPIAVRRVEFLLAPVVLVAAMGVVGLARGVARYAGRGAGRAVGAVLVATVLVLSALGVGAYYGTEKTEYRALAATLRAAPEDATVVVGPVDDRWVPSIRRYLRWRGVDRPLHFIRFGDPETPDFDATGPIVWVTGGPPGGPAFTVRALNSLDDLQVVAGDRTAPGVILPWYVSTSDAADVAAFREQYREISGLPVLLPPPPTSDFPAWFLTGH